MYKIISIIIWSRDWIVWTPCSSEGWRAMWFGGKISSVIDGRKEELRNLGHLILSKLCFFGSSFCFFRGSFGRMLGDAPSKWAILWLFLWFHLFRLIRKANPKIYLPFLTIKEILCLHCFLFSSKLWFSERFICRKSPLYI